MLEKLADIWIARWAQPRKEALDAVAGLRPAAVVTGGSRGIGEAIAQRFAEEGREVVLVARGPSGLAEASNRIMAATGRSPVTAACDITGPDAIARIDIALAGARLYCDVLVNNAGIGLAGPFVSHEERRVADLLALNVQASTALMRHFLPGMLDRGRGGVMTISSMGGLVPGPYQAAYYASKAYQLSLSRAVASENAGRGVRICVVAPGPVETGFHAAMDAEETPYRWLLPASSTRRVATSAVRGYRLGRPVIVPGVLNWTIAAIVGVVPRDVVLPVMKLLLWTGFRDRRADRIERPRQEHDGPRP